MDETAKNEVRALLAHYEENVPPEDLKWVREFADDMLGGELSTF